ncbi:MAG: VCBS repeat-containing protein [Saprospiraceae bacterium]|nr:VCBS repeat-containing protein [Saprospiraceae bacterium]
MKNCIYIFLVLSLSWACQNTEPRIQEIGTHFEAVSAEYSGLSFSNDILENDTLNYYTFPYLYMGGGISLGDINNDGLLDIYVTGNMVANRLYLNKGNLQFEDISEQAGVSGDSRWYTGTTMVDINADGWMDIYVCVSGKHPPFNNQLFINNKDNTFTEMAAEYGIDDASPSIQASFFDYDLDGLLDLFVGNYPQIPVSQGNAFYSIRMHQNLLEESGHLYRNNGDGSFSDVTAAARVQHFGLTLGLASSDFNQDGYPDLYVSNDFNVPDYLYLNQQDGTFKEVIKETTRHTSLFGMGIDAADFNNDGLIDFAQVDMTPEDYKRAKTNMASMSPSTFWEGVELGFHYQYMQNSLQLNNGITTNGLPIFSDISRLAGMATTDWSWGIQFMDLDNDGWKDVFISNGMKRDVNNNDVLNQSDPNSFFGANERNYADLPSQPIDNYAFQNQGGLRFSKTTHEWGLSNKGFTNGFAHGDLDNDGDLDLVMTNLDDQIGLYQNQTPTHQHHYLQIQFKGPKHNPFGIGTKVSIETGELQQMQELSLTRGFQSSVAPILHFGLGQESSIQKLKITWPDGKKQILEEVTVDQLLEVQYREAYAGRELVENVSPRFENITAKAQIDFHHQENFYDDFHHEPLLPHRYSRLGPALAVGDVNGDQLEDFFIGNATGTSSQLYTQTQQGQFQSMAGPWEDTPTFEPTGALFFDADHDGDQDLYVVHGGNNPNLSDQHYQDRLYVNTPKGFVYAEKALPPMRSSGLVVEAGDWDGNGATDLFVGGRIVPGQYPLAPPSFLLKNKGGIDEDLRFVNVTAEVAPALEAPGLVTAASWEDFDQDGLLDLVLTGEWMPIRFFKNSGQKLEDITNELAGLENMEGWWYSMKFADLDNDGDMDLICGNLGLNYKYKASAKEPFEVYANDFDENNSLDIVLSYKKKGVQLPVRGRECSAQQVPAIAARFATFDAFAEADLNDLYGEQMLTQSLHLQATSFESVWLENKGTEGFTRHALPIQAQLSSINSIEVIDYNGDDYKDLLLFGNLYAAEVETPRNDAGIGLVLVGGPAGQFSAVAAQESGLFVPGDAKATAAIAWGRDKKQAYLVGLNDDALQLMLLDQ